MNAIRFAPAVLACLVWCAPTSAAVDLARVTPAGTIAGEHVHVIAAGDVDGDGRPDLAIGPTADGRVFTVPVGAPLVAGSGLTITHVGQQSRIAAADIDGDGLTDLAIADPGFIKFAVPALPGRVVVVHGTRAPRVVSALSATIARGASLKRGITGQLAAAPGRIAWATLDGVVHVAGRQSLTLSRTALAAAVGGKPTYLQPPSALVWTSRGLLAGFGFSGPHGGGAVALFALPSGAPLAVVRESAADAGFGRFLSADRDLTGDGIPDWLVTNEFGSSSDPLFNPKPAFRFASVWMVDGATAGRHRAPTPLTAGPGNATPTAGALSATGETDIVSPAPEAYVRCRASAGSIAIIDPRNPKRLGRIDGPRPRSRAREPVVLRDGSVIILTSRGHNTTVYRVRPPFPLADTFPGVLAEFGPRRCGAQR